MVQTHSPPQRPGQCVCVCFCVVCAFVLCVTDAVIVIIVPLVDFFTRLKSEREVRNSCTHFVWGTNYLEVSTG